MENNGKMNFVGGMDAWSMNHAQTLTEMERDAAVKMHNEAIDAKTKALNAKVKEEMDKAKEITEKMESMEIMPCGNYVLVNPYKKNPYEKIEVTNSGLVIPMYDGSFKNPDTGEEDTKENFACQGTVIAVGPLVKWIKEGDDIFYRRAQAVPVPFFKLGYEVVAEQQIQCVVNEGISARWDSIKKNE